MTDRQPGHDAAWPSLRVADWAATRDTVHLWTQIVGKVRLAHAPMLNHWWRVPLYVSPRGLTTSSIPHGSTVFDMEFDFCDHRVVIRVDDGRSRTIDLGPMPVAEFHARVMADLDRLGLGTRISATPNEVDPAIPFAEDTGHASYGPEALHAFWRQLVQADRLIQRFRSSKRRMRPPRNSAAGTGPRWRPTRPGGATAERRQTVRGRFTEASLEAGAPIGVSPAQPRSEPGAVPRHPR